MRLPIVVPLLLAIVPLPSMMADSYEQQIQQWRAERVKKLKADDGWLTVSGLFWLQEGINAVGSAPGSRVELPSTAPAHLADFVLEKGKVSLALAGVNGLKLNGKPAIGQVLKNDSAEKPDLVQWGDLTLIVLERGARTGIRLKDKNSQYRREFTSLNWFPIDPKYRYQARFTAYEKPRKVVYETRINEPQEYVSPGYVNFVVDGVEQRLEPVLEDGKLFFVFRDRTSPRESYGAGRFLYAALPGKDGIVDLDFNRAYNPPCVFTPFATCPLPTPANRLSIRIPAGEKNYHTESETISEAR